jgi:hypothetical protein
MGRQIAWDDIPDSNIVPEGIYQVEIVDIEEVLTKAQAVMYKASFSIVTPEDFAGLYVRDMYVIGTATDPGAEHPDTWKASIGARRMKKMLKDAAVPMDADLDNTLAAAPGAQFLTSVSIEVDDGTRNDGKYKGMSNNRVGSTYPLGFKEVGVVSVNGTQAAAAVAPPPRPAAPAAARTVTAPAAGVAGRPVAGSAQTVKAAPPPRGAPAAAPRAVPARAAAPAPVAAPVAASMAGAAMEVAYPCAICKQAGATNFMVPESQFEEHVAQHA